MGYQDEHDPAEDTPRQTSLALSLHGKQVFGVALQDARQALQHGLRELMEAKLEADRRGDRAVSEELSASYDKLSIYLQALG